MNQIYITETRRVNLNLSISFKKLLLLSFLLIANFLFVHNQAYAILFGSASISASKSIPICSGTNVSLSITVSSSCLTSGSYAIGNYQWQESTTGQGSWNNVATTSTYTTPVLNVTKYYRCILTNITGRCSGVAATCTTAVKTISVSSSVTPSVSIAQSPSGTVCSSTNVRFTPTPSNGGTSPTYQWYVNGTSMGTGSTYSSTSLTNGQVVSCVMTSNASCVTSTTASSNSVTMSVSTSVTPSVSITQSPSGTVCSGTNVTFTPSPSNGGASPTYRWYVNGTSMGTGSTYSSTTLSNGQAVSCVMTSNASCVTSTTATSNSISMAIGSSPSITSYPANARVNCAGDLASFSITASGSNLSFQWQKVQGSTTTNLNEGVTNSGTTSTLTFTTATGDDAYTYQCVVSSNGCSTTSVPAAMLSFLMSSSISINSSPENQTQVEGGQVSFNVSASGTDLTYQWQKSSNSGESYTDIEGANSAEYSFQTSIADNGAYYRCEVGSSSYTLTCNAYSNSGLLTVLEGFPETLTLYSSDLSSSHTENYTINNTCEDLTTSFSYARLYVQFDLGEDYTLGSGASFNLQEVVSITPYTKDEKPGSAKTCTLQLISSSTTPLVEQLAWIDLGDITSNFSNYDYCIISFNPITATSTSDDIIAMARVSAWIEDDVKTDVLSGSYELTPLVSLERVNISENSNRVLFSWNSICDNLIDRYQIQILRLYNQDEGNTSSNYTKSNTIDWNKALTIEVENQTSISIELMEGSGHHLWRVRPIGDYYDGGVANSNNWGVWSSCTATSGNYTIQENSAEISIIANSILPEFAFYFTQQGNDINSIYNRAFTESNRIAEGITYANGLGMAKQSQRKLSELDGYILMNATAYDYVGRPAIQSMTAPIEQDNLGYKNQLITADHDEDGNVDGLYGPQDFDSNNTTQFPDDDSPVPIWENPLKMQGPINDYYSNTNPDINIPNAGNFPYSKTLYDKLGRAKKVSLLGDEHRMGLYAETYQDGGLQRTIRTYIAAVPDSNLLPVFGNEAPLDTLMYQIVRVDPCEVATVEFKAKDGKTIATCLINTGDNPLLDDISESQKNYAVEIKGNTKVDENTLVKEQSLNFSIPNATLFVDYTLDIKDFEASCIDYCRTCDYKIDFYIIRQETNEIVWSKNETITPEECNLAASTYTYNQKELGESGISLSDPGNYIIGRKIYLNNEKKTIQADGDNDDMKYRDYHQSEITDLLETEAEKFDVLLTYVDQEGDNLDNLYDYLDALPSGESSSCDETLSNAGSITTSSDVTSGGISTEVNIDAGSINVSSYNNSSGDLWLVSKEEDDNGTTIYTVASSCLEIQIPKVDCDYSPCDDYWETTGTEDYQTELINQYGGFYDFEKLLYESNSYPYLNAYFKDPYGNSKYPSGISDEIEIELTYYNNSGAPGSYLNMPSVTFTYLVNESEGENSVTISSSTVNITLNSFASLVNSELTSLLRDYGYTVMVSNESNTKSIITLETDFSSGSISPNHYINVSSFSSNGSYLTVSGPAAYTRTTDADNNFPLGTGAINAMLTHMVKDDSYDCNEVYYAWESIAKNMESYMSPIYDESGSLVYQDALEIFLSIVGHRYQGFSNMPYGYQNANLRYSYERYNESTRDYGYGYLEYAYKYFAFDTTRYYDEVNAVSDLEKACVEDFGIVYQDLSDSWSDPVFWDASTCGSAWYSSGKIADDYEEEFQCKAYEQFHYCLLGDFDHYQSMLGLTSCGDATITSACASNMCDLKEEDIEDVLSNRVSGIAASLKANVSSSSTIGLRRLSAKELTNNLQSEFSLTYTDDGSGNYQCGTDAEIELAQKIIGNRLSISSGSVTDANYIASATYKGAQIAKDYLNDRFSGQSSVSSSDINEALDDLFDDFGWSKDYISLTSALSCLSAILKNTTATTLTASNSSGISFTNSNNTLKIANVTGGIGTNLERTLLTLGTNYNSVSTLGFTYDWGDQFSLPSISTYKLIQPCDTIALYYIKHTIESGVSDAKQCRLEKSLSSYDKHCTLTKSKNVEDEFKISYSVDYIHYTLFYYDIAGNLVETVPPLGVDTTTGKDADGNQTTDKNQIVKYLATRADVKDHKLSTKYQYNSIGQRTYESTPDGGEKQFWYNSIGQLRFSQNAKQKTDANYAYLKYDELGRIKESGLSTQDVGSQAFSAYVDEEDYPSSGLTFRTVSVYDEPETSLTYGGTGSTEQQYLQNRISYAYSDADGSDKNGDENYTYYSYDPHGNVEWMLQSINGLGQNKYLAYEYDLISGKITKVKYNEGMNDQFFYRYTYDSDGRIEEVESSRDGYLWESDIKYEYYAYGPLKRLSIGEDKIQGLDYVYTINGWLKAVNHPSLNAAYDPGADGASGSSYPTDAFGMSLGYFEGDFKRYYDANGDGSRDRTTESSSVFNSINTANYSNESYKYQHEWYTDEVESSIHEGASFPTYLVNYRPLYNGTITNITYNQPSAGSSSNYNGNMVSFMYNYDELYRLTNASFDYFEDAVALWHRRNMTSGIFNDYSSSCTFDGNGNILTLNRYTRNNVQFDGLTYNYPDKNSDDLIDNNKLIRVDDSKSSNNIATDIEDQSGVNYEYDDIGQLITDDAEDISDIEWTPSGKIAKVTYGSTKYIKFNYDALGNRISKIVYESNADKDPDITYYVNNATGSTMAIYQTPGTGSTDADLIEMPLYGTSRIGELATAIDDDAAISAESTTNVYSRYAGNKKYEISDYLGNVRAVVKDIKKDEDGDGIFEADVEVSNDYFPFGMLLPGRAANTEDYRYGFNGKEMDNEVKDKTATSYDFGARMYDPRLGRWLSLDPLAEKLPSESPYEFVFNNPINFVDIEGKMGERFVIWLLNLLVPKYIMDDADVVVELIGSYGLQASESIIIERIGGGWRKEHKEVYTYNRSDQTFEVEEGVVEETASFDIVIWGAKKNNTTDEWEGHAWRLGVDSKGAYIDLGVGLAVFLGLEVAVKIYPDFLNPDNNTPSQTQALIRDVKTWDNEIERIDQRINELNKLEQNDQTKNAIKEYEREKELYIKIREKVKEDSEKAAREKNDEY